MGLTYELVIAAVVQFSWSTVRIEAASNTLLSVFHRWNPLSCAKAVLSFVTRAISFFVRIIHPKLKVQFCKTVEIKDAVTALTLPPFATMKWDSPCVVKFLPTALQSPVLKGCQSAQLFVLGRM